MKKFIFCTFLVVLFTTLVFAQNQTSTDYNKREFFAGYSTYNSANGTSNELEFEDLDSNPTFRGWNASATYNFKRYLGVKADVSGHYRNETLAATPINIKTKSTTYNFMGGIQIKDNKKTKRFSPFVHALAGVSTSKFEFNTNLSNLSFSESQTNFTAAVGAGIDLKVKKNISIRLIQVDYNPSFQSGFTEHRIRAGFGIVIH